MVMDHGAVIADDTAWALKESLAGDRVTLTFASATDAAAAAARIGGAVDGTAGADRHGGDGDRPDGDRALPRWIRELGDAGLDVVAATHRQPTLDDVFLALTGRSLREEAARRGIRRARRRLTRSTRRMSEDTP